MQGVDEYADVPLPPSPPADSSRWGLIDAAWGWVVAVVLGAIAGAAIVQVAGYDATKTKDWPLWLVAVTQVPLWFGLVAAPFVAIKRAGGTLRSEFGFAFEARDVPMGLALGVACQFVLVPLISWPWLKLLGKNGHDLSKSAVDLVDKATDPLGVVLLIAIVVIGAPFIEELFYRGLFFRSLAKVVPMWAAIVLCGLGFGASHFQLLGLPALSVFGMLLAYLAFKTSRLGLSIFTHLGFNAVTVWMVLAR